MEKQCKYCGCNKIDCLAQCSKTKYYFCNGKGDTSSSHIIHHLKTSNLSQINFPEENPFCQIPIQCYICDSANIFRLGYVFTTEGNTLFVCSQCLDKAKSTMENLRPETFELIVQSDQIYNEIVEVPQADEYSEIPIAKIKSIEGSIQNETDSDQHAKFLYQTKQDYFSFMSNFVSIEKSEIEKSVLEFEDIFITRKDDIGIFSAPYFLFDNISVGTRLSIHSKNQPEYAYVISKRVDFSVVVQFVSGFELTISQIEMKSTIKVSPELQVYDNQASALSCFLKTPNCMNKSLVGFLLGENQKSGELNEPLTFSRIQIRLTPNQIRCIKHSLSHRFSLIEGPPGTGKTRIVTGIVASFLNNRIMPILVCAENDQLADILACRLTQARINVCRVYPLYFPNDNLNFNSNISLAARQYGSSFERDFKQRYRNKTSMESVLSCQREVINSATVICTTCDMLYTELFDKIPKFQTVIIDDSQNVLDPQLLEVITKQCEQLILVGDVLGLHHSLYSSISQESRYDFPLFERLIANGFKPLFLNESFRSHPQLVDFLSTIFYGGFLKSSVPATPNLFSIWPNKSIPYFFWNLPQSKEIVVPYSSGKYGFVNEMEISSISTLIEAMIKDQIMPQQIGVITPYVTQHHILVNCLRKFGNTVKSIEIGNVEWFEGREKDFIIISTVLANESITDIDKLGDKRRLNVAMSRAKLGMIIVGNANSLCKNGIWESIISYSIEKNVFVEGNLDSLVPSTKPTV